jgi:hypothetical protein
MVMHGCVQAAQPATMGKKDLVWERGYAVDVSIRKDDDPDTAKAKMIFKFRCSFCGTVRLLDTSIVAA